MKIVMRLFSIPVVFLAMSCIGGQKESTGTSSFSVDQAQSYLLNYYWIETGDSDGTLNGDGKKTIIYIHNGVLTVYLQNAEGSSSYTKSEEKPYQKIVSWQEEANSFVVSNEEGALLAFGFLDNTRIWIWDDDVSDDELFDRTSDLSSLGITLE